MSSEQQAGGESIFTLNHSESSPLAEFERVESVDPWSYWVNAGDVVKRAEFDRLLAYAKALHAELSESLSQIEVRKSDRFMWTSVAIASEKHVVELEAQLSSLHAAAVKLAPHRIVNGLYGSKLCLECLQHAGAAELIPHTPNCPAGLVLNLK